MEKLIILLGFFMWSCNSGIQKNENPKGQIAKSENAVAKNKLAALKIKNEKPFRLGETVAFEFDLATPQNPDSVRISVNGSAARQLNFSGNQLVWNTTGMKPGIQTLSFSFFWEKGYPESKSLQIVLLSDLVPEKYSYKVVKTWPHSTKAYTQGLEFYQGFLFEGTGQKGASMLNKINIGTNEIEQSLNLPADVFGEGITIFDKKIYQLTWQSNVGYVYDVNDFRKLYEFNYPTEGWGLTNNGKELIMSDGSENIYFLDAEFLQETHRLQVYDNKGPVKYLNELEMIGNEIFANVYGTDRIVAFDIATGRVTKEIDMTGILKPKETKEPVDVLNGIAYNQETQQLWVTGKWWPKLFQIELVKK